MKDTGYNSRNSWVATFACSLVKLMATVPMRLSGLFFVIIIDHFQTSRKLASVPFVVYGTIRNLGGPFVGCLGEIFGLRCIICIGSVLVAVGVGACFFAKDIVMVTLFLGLIYGTGFAFINNLIHSVIRQHFNKNISMANGLCLFGSCLGNTIISPVIHYLVNSYGMSGFIMEFIDKDKQNMALASRFTLYGVFSLLKSLLIGFFRENLGSYDGIYYLMIASYIFCIILSYLTPISASRKKRKKVVN